jgi:hypothetical protein
MMRVWDIPVWRLCRKHLLAQHVEIHAIYNIITRGLKGYANHPEVMRWRGHESALRSRHEATKNEMLRRGYKHNSPINGRISDKEPQKLESVREQIRILTKKDCPCLRKKGVA